MVDVQAQVVREFGGAEAVEMVDDWPDPVAGDDQVLIRVHSAGVSYPDLLMVGGRYQRRPELPFVPGLEVAGVVERASRSSGLRVGDAVVAVTDSGGWAELVACPPSAVLPMPSTMSFVDGVALSMNYLTAYYALLVRGRLRPDEVVLVHGAAGGLGSAALQLAKAGGARTIAVVSCPAKGDVARACGADEVVLTEGWISDVRELVGPAGIDLVVDPVGGDRTEQSLRLLRVNGRLLALGFTAGAIPSIPVNRLLLRNIDLVGVAWGAAVRADPQLMRQHWEQVTTFWAGGGVRPVRGETFALARCADALRVLGERRAVGKVTLNVASDS